MSGYVRTTRDEYDVEGNYGYGWEAVTCEETLSEARARLREYRENEPGYAHRIVKRRVPLAGITIKCSVCDSTFPTQAERDRHYDRCAVWKGPFDTHLRVAEEVSA